MTDTSADRNRILRARKAAGHRVYPLDLPEADTAEALLETGWLEAANCENHDAIIGALERLVLYLIALDETTGETRLGVLRNRRI